MKKGNVIIIVLIVGVLAILVLGYLGRHRIKAMLGMSATPVPVETTSTQTAVGTNPAAAAPSDNIYLTKADSVKRSYMTDFNGMTLYTYDKDTTGVSNCTGGCLKAWPAYTSGAVAENSLPENITVITRSDDGTKQFAWKGMPLYYYATDVKAGDITGDGVGGVWHIVKL